MITSLLLNKTKPCIIVFLVSGVNCTPPPLIPAVAPAFPPTFKDDVEAAGAEANNKPDKIEGNSPVTVGYK